MGEKQGFLTVILLFAITVVPTLLTSFITHVEGSKVMNISTEFQQIVSAEGGLKGRAATAQGEMASRGLNISVVNENGGSASNPRVGDTLRMTYHYDGLKTDFETENKVTILRR